MLKPNIYYLLAKQFTNPDGTYKNEITQEVINTIFEHRLFKLFLPNALGGLGLGMMDTLAVIREAAYLNGSLGWLIQIGNGGMYFATNFPEEISTQLFSPADAVIAGSGTVYGTCVDVDGGVCISGSWKYCSGSAYATLFTVTVMRADGTVCAAILPSKDVTILNDWQTIGLTQTSTNTIVLDDVFVPHQSIFSVFERKSFKDYAVFNLPFLIYAQAFFSSVAFGIFERLLHEAEQVNNQKQLPNVVLSDCIQQGKAMLQQAIAQSNQWVTDIQNRTSELSTEEDLQIQTWYKTTVKQLRHHAHELHAQLGMHGLYAQNTFTIFYLDLLAATQHKLLMSI
jgi:alkylation response protein AidB-like acyl-CoA dehydrogenase